MKTIFRLSLVVALLAASFSVALANPEPPDPSSPDLANRLFLPVVVETQNQSGIGLSDEPLSIPELTIMEIQGNDQFSPYDGQKVMTSGIVTLFTSDDRSCWLQDPQGDDDPATSDGIFVYNCRYLYVNVGDYIRLTATVDEYQFAPALPLTELTSYLTLIEVISTGNPLPKPVMLSDLPNESITEGINFWEPLEGMLVAVENAPVVGPTNAYGEFIVLTNEDAKPGSGFYPQTQQILLRSLGEDKVDYNPERVMVDDSSLDEPIIVMPGDRVRSLVGVVDYNFGNYKLQPVSYDVKTHKANKAQTSTRSGSYGDTAITTFNVENLFDLEINEPTTVDVFGQVGFDPGSSWGPPPTVNNTLRRKADVCQGDHIGDNPFDPSIEWEGYGNDNFDDLGSHNVTCEVATDLFISEYVEGSSLNKAIEVYNGTGETVNLGASGYTIRIYFNGNTSAGTTIPLSGTLAPGDVFVVADDGAAQAILDVADQTSTSNFFNGDDAVVLTKGGKDDASSTPTPEDLETKLAKLAQAIIVEMELPEILIVQEVENTAILQQLGDRVNAAVGTNYQAVSFETSDARGIEVGFLWDANRVDLLDAYQMAGPDVEAAFGASSDSPGREPLVGVFNIAEQEITIIGNHFKSKGGDDPLFGLNDPPVRITEAQRKLQAQVVRNFVNSLLDEDPNALVLVAGDLNDFQFGEPGEGEDHPIAILEGFYGGVPLTDLINLEKDAERFTYMYDGNSQVLDHMLVSPALLDLLVGVDALHFNASFPYDYIWDASTPLHVSDHDPLEGRFVFGK